MAATAVLNPQDGGLTEICDLLEQQNSPSPVVDKSQIWKQLQHFSQFPDFNNYLVFILVRAELHLHALIVEKIPVSFSGQVTKDEKDANLQLEIASSVKHGESRSTSLGFDLVASVDSLHFGEVLATTEHEEDIIIGEIDYYVLEQRRTSLPLNKQRRGDLYQLVDVQRLDSE